MGYLPTLYKAKVATKQPCCAICLDRTRGKTQRVSFGYGVSVYFCQSHASVEFLTQRGGRDLVVSLSEVWRAAGCLTTARHKALNAHLAGLKQKPQRPRPGSYAWPTLRVQAERLFAQGTPVAQVTERILTARFENANPPSPRTIHRWHAQRRWTRRAPPRARLG
jgi:hypothetical protein